ncbi:hypothetical protein ACDX78_16750 [Virgibacillus oceani]
MFEEQLQITVDPWANWVYAENGLNGALLVLFVALLQQGIIWWVHKTKESKVENITGFYFKSMVNNEHRTGALIKVIGVSALIYLFYLLSFVFTSEIMLPLYIVSHVLITLTIFNETIAIIIAAFLFSNKNDTGRSLHLKVYKVMTLLGIIYFAGYFFVYSNFIILASAWISLLLGVLSYLELKIRKKVIFR